MEKKKFLKEKVISPCERIRLRTHSESDPDYFQVFPPANVRMNPLY